MKQKFLMVLIAVVAIMTAGSTASAQNANRKGWIIELQGGRTIGTVCESIGLDYHVTNGDPAYRLKAGIKGSLGFGYRWTTSQFCAFEAKAVVSDNFAEKQLLNISLMPGFRYTTKEISGNASMYFAANVGVGLYPATDYLSYSVVGEAGVGFNIGSRLSLGLYIDYTVPFGDCQLDIEKPYNDLSGTPLVQLFSVEAKSNATVGVKFGFRI